MHKSLHIENLRNISQSMPGESNGFHANPLYCAVPMSGSAGLIAIIRVNPCLFLFSVLLPRALLVIIYEGHSINKLLNSIILMVFQI